MNVHRLACGKSCQSVEKRPVVGLGEEDRRSVDAAQDRVHRKAGSDDARMSWHSCWLHSGDRWPYCSRKPWSVPGFACGFAMDVFRQHGITGNPCLRLDAAADENPWLPAIEIGP